MKSKTLFAIVLMAALIYAGCNKNATGDSPSVLAAKMEVVINDIPFQTEKYLRIPYTLKMWEWEKDGLKLQQIVVLDGSSKAELMTIDKADLPFIYKPPLIVNPFVTYDEISSYYLSIQLPILLTQTKPAKVSHRFVFDDTIHNSTVTVEGAVFLPRIDESPITISSPVKGNNWLFINQSTMAYHFYVVFFVNGGMARAERFAFDNVKLDATMTDILSGDPKVNASYFNYRDTLYAVASGTVVSIKDGRAENSGDAHDVPLNTLDEYGGNYLILDIGDSHYAFYAHCVPHSFMVNIGDVVNEGDPIALLGNSGNSDAPHLHFQITDGMELLFSNGLPFVLKQYTKVADIVAGSVTPTRYTNSMMEQYSIIDF